MPKENPHGGHRRDRGLAPGGGGMVASRGVAARRGPLLQPPPLVHVLLLLAAAATGPASARQCSRDAAGWTYCDSVGAACADNAGLVFGVRLWTADGTELQPAGCQFSYSRTGNFQDAARWPGQGPVTLDWGGQGWASGPSQTFDYLVSRCLGGDTTCAHVRHGRARRAIWS